MEQGAQVAQSFASSLEHLHTDYLDSYVLHGPTQSVGLGDDDWQIWGAMSALERQGQARVLGVSNVSAEQLAELWRASEVKPVFVQNRCYARDGWDQEVRAFCRAHELAYQGFSLLTANRRELGSPALRRIAERHQRTIAQVVFAFARTVGMIPLTGTASRAHMDEDLAGLDLALDDDEVRAIETISG